MNKNRNLIVGIALIIIVTAFISFSAASMLFFTWNNFIPKYNLEFEPKDGVVKTDIDRINDIKYKLKKYFYKDVSEKVLLEGAISGMANSLDDPYTVYFNKEQMKLFEEKNEGSYVGIGVSISLDKDGILNIIEPFEGSPAKEAGIKKGDKIIKVDKKDVTSIKDEELIIKMIKGTENTKVKITVYRPSENKPIEFEMKRKRIKIDNIKSELKEKNIGYIKLNMFDSNSAKDFKEHLQKLIDKNIKALIIDVRDNPGGSYNEVVDIADRLIPKGLIVKTIDRKGSTEEERSGKSSLEVPITVLINGNSASASEILAGAIKDNKKGILVGEKTFGKGLVQGVYDLPGGAGLKITIAKYYTPSGVCIQDKGIEPDIKVELDNNFKDKPISQVDEKDDVQLKKAIELTKGKIK